MPKSITREQLEEIEDEYSYGDRESAYELLKEYTGIEAKPYTAWVFYDEVGNWIGDSDNYTIEELLENAYISVVDESEVTDDA